MQFTGENLVLIREALELAQSELHNQIATCPDVYEYADDIEELESEKRKLKRLMDRIDRHNGVRRRVRLLGGD